MVERVNGTIKSAIFAMYEEFKGQWIQGLQFAVFAYNTSVSEATLHTPFFLLYGREALSLGDVIATAADEDQDFVPTDVLAQGMRNDMLKAHTFVKSLMDSKTLRVHEQNMKLARIPVFHLGDKVYLHDQRVRRRQAGDERAHVRPYSGPWRVTARLGETTYTVEPLFKGKAQSTTVHISRMKPFTSADGDDTPTRDAPFSMPASNGPIRIPSGRVHPGLGAVNAEDALQLASDPKELTRAEKHATQAAQAMELDSPTSPLQEPVSPGRVYSPTSPPYEFPSSSSSDGEEKEQTAELRPLAQHQKTTYVPPAQTVSFTATPTLTGPAAAAAAHRRQGWRRNLNENLQHASEIEPRASHRLSLAPRAGLASDAPPTKRKGILKRKSRTSRT